MAFGDDHMAELRKMFDQAFDAEMPTRAVEASISDHPGSAAATGDARSFISVPRLPSSFSHKPRARVVVIRRMKHDALTGGLQSDGAGGAGASRL